MGKKNRQPAAPLEAGENTEEISARGWILIVVGAFIVASGFVVLSMTDPMGRNWASHLSPFLILGGYGLVALGIFLPESFSPPVPLPEKTGSRPELG